MKLENICISLELAKKLKELGVDRSCLFYYYENRLVKNEFDIQVRNIYDHLEGYPAYCCDELLELLPKNISRDYDGKHYQWDVVIYKNNKTWMVDYKEFWESDSNMPVKSKRLCDALAKMLVYLLENKLITLEK